MGWRITATGIHSRKTPATNNRGKLEDRADRLRIKQPGGGGDLVQSFSRNMVMLLFILVRGFPGVRSNQIVFLRRRDTCAVSSPTRVVDLLFT